MGRSRRNNHFIAPIFILLSCAILLLLISSTAEAEEYDYTVENTIQGIRDYSTFFTSPDDSRICILSGTSASIYDVSTGNLVVERQFEDMQILDGCWIGDNIVIATFESRDGEFHPDPILILSPNDLASVEEHSPTTQYLRNLEASPTGKFIAASVKNELLVFDTVNYELIYESDIHAYSIKKIAWDDGEGRIASVGYHIYIHDISEKTTQKISPDEVTTELLFWAQEDTRIYSLERSGVMEYYNVTSGEREFDDGISSRINGGDVNPSNNDVCFGHGADWIILSLDTLEKKKEVQDAAGLIRKIVWNWETYRLLTMAKDGVLRIYRDSNDPSYNSPPVVTIIKPGGGETITTDLIAEGTMTDDIQVLVGFYRLNDGNWLVVGETSHWTLTIESIDMVEGTNTLYVKANDGDRETVAQVTFVFKPMIANEPPTLEVLSPANGSEVRSLVRISGTSSDDRYVTTVRVRIDDSEWQAATGTESWTITLLLDDLLSDWHLIEAKASDGELESRIVTVNVFMNTTVPPLNERPTIQVDSPVSFETVLRDVLCKGTSRDDGSTVQTLLSQDGTTWTLLSTEEDWEEIIDLIEMEAGTHLLSFISFDTILSSDVVEVQVEKLPYSRPMVVIENPEADHPFSSTFRFEGRVDEGHGEDILVELRVGEGEWTVIGQSRELTYQFVPDSLAFGNITFLFRAGDTYSISVTVEHVCIYYKIPEVTIEQPSPGQRVVGDVLLSGTVAFGYGNISSLEIRIDGSDWIPVNGSRSWEIVLRSSELPIGDVMLEVRATDGRVYSGPASVSIVHDVKRVNEPGVPNYLILAVLVGVILLVSSVYVVKRYRH